jgi:hypothetical protein
MHEQIVDDALADIALHPEHHSQREYFGTGPHYYPPGDVISPLGECHTTMCLAGFIALRAGCTFVHVARGHVECRLPAGFPAPSRKVKYLSIQEAAQIAADLTWEESAEMFEFSDRDDYKQLTARWNRLTERER